MTDQIPLRLISILNCALAPRLCVHVMARTVPLVHVTAVLGEVTVTLAATSENLPLTPLAKKPFADTPTIAVVVADPVAVQAKLPVLGAVEASVVYVLPPLRLSSIFTVAVGSRFDVQAI